MGRPPKYTEETLELRISQWDESFKNSKALRTKANFCLALDISFDTYNRWKKKEHEFSETIKRIELRIEEEWVQRLTGNSVAGTIFYLKNAFKNKYRDRYDTDITSGGEKVVPIYAGQSISKHTGNEKAILSDKED